MKCVGLQQMAETVFENAWAWGFEEFAQRLNLPTKCPNCEANGRQMKNLETERRFLAFRCLAADFRKAARAMAEFTEAELDILFSPAEAANAAAH